MISFKLFLAVYLLGGITFIPLLVITLLYANKWSERLRTGDRNGFDEQLLLTGLDPEFKAGEIEEPKGVKVYRKGWLTVTKKYYYHHSEVAQMVEKEGQDVDVPQRSQLKKRHKFFAVLKHGNLFLYRDDSQKSNLIHAISLQGSFITIWPRDPKHEAPDASMFTKKTCISILRNGTVKYDGSLHFEKKPDEQENSSWSQFYLYFENNIEKEDWYFALINVSKRDPKDQTKPSSVIDPNNCARTAHLKTADSLYLIQAIHSTEGQLSAKWLNALLGRLFLSLQRTDALKNYIYGRLYKKLTKLNKPGFLDDFVIEEVDVGTSAPMITNPQLLELAPTGLTRISLNMQYRGNVSVIVATNVTINLGSHFRQRQVPVQLAIKLNELRGPMFLMIKPPPSNRLWYTFQSEPILDVDIEPVVSSSKFSYGMVTNAIKSKLKEAIKESLVVPFWDDFAFYNTEDEIYRAGIWEKFDEKVNPSGFEDHGQTTEDLVDHKDNKATSEKSDDQADNRVSSENSDDRSEENSTSSDESSISERPQALKPRSMSKHSGSISSGEMHRTKSSDSIKTQDSNLKTRTLQRVEHFKKAFSNKNKDDSDDEQTLDDDENSGDEDPKDSSDSKKYFKNSLKKIGKWYRGSSDNESEETSHGRSSGSRASSYMGKPANNHTPEMISNRRKTLPRRPVPPPLKSPTSPSSVSSASFSPTLNATEMFANKSRSLSNMSSETNDSVVSPALASHNHAAFVKPRRAPGFSEELFADKMEDPDISTTPTNQEGSRNTSERFGPPEAPPRPELSSEPLPNHDNRVLSSNVMESDRSN